MSKLWGKLTEHSDSELEHAQHVLSKFSTPTAKDDLAAVEAEIAARKDHDDEASR